MIRTVSNQFLRIGQVDVPLGELHGRMSHEILKVEWLAAVLSIESLRAEPDRWNRMSGPVFLPQDLVVS